MTGRHLDAHPSNGMSLFLPTLSPLMRSTSSRSGKIGERRYR